MGRTNPTYRYWLEQFEQEWQPYRRALRHRYHADFDRLFEKANRHADAAGYTNRANPIEAAFMSILLAQETEIRDLRTRIDRLETHD